MSLLDGFQPRASREERGEKYDQHTHAVLSDDPDNIVHRVPGCPRCERLAKEGR